MCILVLYTLAHNAHPNSAGWSSLLPASSQSFMHPGLDLYQPNPDLCFGTVPCRPIVNAPLSPKRPSIRHPPH